MENKSFTDIDFHDPATDIVQNGSNNNNHIHSGGANGYGTTQGNGAAQTQARPYRPSRLGAVGSFFHSIRNHMIEGLERVFYKIGVTIARYPVITIVISVIVPLLLFIGMKDFQFDEDFANLLLPPSSRIRYDRKWVEENVPFEQRPIRLVFKNKNVLTKESLLGLYDFHSNLTKLTVDGDQTFETLCVRIGSQCFVDSLLALWRNNNDTISKLTDQEIIDAVNTVKTNPTYFFAFNATRMLSGLTRNTSNHIVGAEVMHADWFIQSSIELRPVAKKLEYKATDFALAGHPQFDSIDVFTMDAYFEEFFKGVYGDVILIAYGFPVVVLYVILAMGKCNLVEHGTMLTLAAIVGVGLSAGACFGLGLAAGFLFGAPHQALIFLLLAVGVDDAFVIVKTWNRINAAHRDVSIEERVGLTMQHAGVSVTVTSISDLVAFACGISTQMPVLRSFCVYCSIGIFFLFLMQSTLFPACLTLNQRRVEANRDGLVPFIVHEKKTPDGCGDREFVAMFFKKFFAPVILSTPGKIIVILLTVALAAVMGYGVSQLQKGFEFEKSLPEDSFVRHFLKAQRLYFASEGPGIQVYCTPMDYQKNINVLDEMAKTYQNSSVVMYGLVANWIPMYKLYAGLFGTALNVSINEDGVPSDPDDFHNLLRDFFKTPLGLPFSKYVEMTDTTPPEILWTYFPMQQIVSQDVWENEYIMEEVRRIADTTTAERLDGGRCFVYSVFHIFTEVIRYIDSEIMRNFILAGIAIFIVTLLLIVDFVTSFFVLVCVGLTLLDIMGSLQYWGFYMDVNAVVLLIISIGLAVDFSAHVGYTFMTVTGTKNERTTKTLCQIGPAILHGAVTTYLVFFVLVFGKSLSLFFGVFILVVKFGLFHGLCFLPVVLSIIGPSPYYNAGPEGTDTVGTVGSGNQGDMEMGHDNPMHTTQAIVGNSASPDGVTNRSEQYNPDSSNQYTNDNSGHTFDKDKSGHQCTSDSFEQQTTDNSEELASDKSEQNTTGSSGQTPTVDSPKYEDVMDLYDTADSCQKSRGTCEEGQGTFKGALAPGEKGFVHTKL